MANLSSEQLEALRSAMLQRESSNNYTARNKLNYVGGYQFGAAALETLGYLKKGASKQGNNAVDNPANWTGKDGLFSLNDFFNRPDIQDKIFDKNVKFNQRILEKKGTIDDQTNPEDLAGYLAASHLLGAGGASKDLTAKDANAVSGLQYYNIGKKAVAQASRPVKTSDQEIPYPVSEDFFVSPSASGQERGITSDMSGAMEPFVPPLPYDITEEDILAPNPFLSQSKVREEAMQSLNEAPQMSTSAPASSSIVGDLFGLNINTTDLPPVDVPTSMDMISIPKVSAPYVPITSAPAPTPAAPAPAPAPVLPTRTPLDFGPMPDTGDIGEGIDSGISAADMESLLAMEGLWTNAPQPVSYDPVFTSGGDFGEGINSGISDADLASLIAMEGLWTMPPMPETNNWDMYETDLDY